MAEGDDRAVESLAQIRNLARECLQEARRSVWDLRSGPLQGMSLSEVLRQEINKITGSNMGTSFSVEGRERVLPAGIEACLLRICQEALANIIKHANANKIAATLIFEDSSVRLVVEDNGIGFDPAIPPRWDREQGGFGLVNMRERAHLLGGELTVESKPGRGTMVTASLPVS